MKSEWISATEYKASFYNIEEHSNSVCVVYNAASGAVLSVEKEKLYNRLFSNNEMRSLIANGFFVPVTEDEFEIYLSNIQFRPKGTPNYFTIIPTTACNAKCFYCYEEDYCKKTINHSTHKKIVDYLANALAHEHDFVLDWYGGEPLLCVNEIDQIISELDEKIDLTARSWSSSITTNATLFNPELIKHAVTYWHLNTAHITIDGTEKEHNARKNVHFDGSSAFKSTIAAIMELLKSGVYVNLRIHLDNLNKDSFPEILNAISHFFEYPNLHLFPTYLFPPEYEIPETYIKDYEKEDLFYNVFHSLKNKKYLKNYQDIFPWPKKQNCFATCSNKVVIGPDGSLHSCVQEFSGSDWDGDEKFWDYSAACIECRGCKYFPICVGGCIHNRSLKNTVRTSCVRNRFVIHPLLRLLLEDS